MKVENTSKRLHKLMDMRHLRQIDILNLTKPYCEAYEVKMNKSDLSQYVSGKVEPNQHKLAVLSMALNVNEAWLMGYDVPMERTNNNATLHANMAKDTYFQKLYIYWEKLSEVGKDKLIEYAVDLSKIYTKN